MTTQNNQNSQSVPSVNDFKTIPEGEAFAKLPTDLKEQLINKFSNQEAESKDQENKDSVEDQNEEEVKKEDQESEESDETDEEEKKEDSEESDKSQDQDENDKEEDSDEPKSKKEVNLEDRFTQLEKNYKSLEAEFTRRSQKLKELSLENETLKAGKETTKGKQEQTETVIEELEQLKKQVKPDALPFLESLIKTVEKMIDQKTTEKVSKVEQQFSAKEASENVVGFQKEVSTFLDGDFKSLEPEMDAIVAEYFPEKEDLIKEASTNPKLFKELFKELKDRHEDKYIKIKTQPKQKDAKERNKEINDTGVSGKSKTSKTNPDPYDIKDFKKKSTKEKEDALRKAGVFVD